MILGLADVDGDGDDDSASSGAKAKMTSSSPRAGGEGVFAVVVDGVTSSATCSGSSGEAPAVEGSVVSDMRYWKPWHPPDSTWMRSARPAFLSLVMIWERRCRGRRSWISELVAQLGYGIRGYGQ